jgi:hypothetical protein
MWLFYYEFFSSNACFEPWVIQCKWGETEDGSWVGKTDKAVVQGLLPSLQTSKQTQNNYTYWLHHSLTYRCKLGSQKTERRECFGTKATCIQYNFNTEQQKSRENTF